MRRSVVSGQLNRAMRYIDKMLDDGYRAVVELQQQGRNATQYVLVREDVVNIKLLLHTVA